MKLHILFCDCYYGIYFNGSIFITTKKKSLILHVTSYDFLKEIKLLIFENFNIPLKQQQLFLYNTESLLCESNEVTTLKNYTIKRGTCFIVKDTYDIPALWELNTDK